MSFNIINFKYSDAELFSQALKIRTKVFVEEQNVPEELEYDGFDDFSNHYLLYYNDYPIAAARVRKTDYGLKLERFAVLKKYRSKGIGKILLEYIIKETDENSLLYLHSQVTAMDFYSRNGFVVYGDAFYEADIKHSKMILKR